jgi:hypothetical protein
MRRMIPDDLFDFALMGAGVLIVSTLIAYSPFTDRPRHPVRAKSNKSSGIMRRTIATRAG